MKLFFAGLLLLTSVAAISRPEIKRPEGDLKNAFAKIQQCVDQLSADTAPVPAQDDSTEGDVTDSSEGDDSVTE